MRNIKNQRGFAVFEVLIILAVLGFVGFVIYRAVTVKPVADNSVPQPSQSNKTVDPTAEWTEYTSAKGKFSLRYPPKWVQPEHKEYCTAGLFARTLYLGPDKSSVLMCGSEFFGQINIGSVDGDQTEDFDDAYDLQDAESESVMVGGVSGKRVSGVVSGQPQEVGATPNGTKMVYYVFFTNNTTYQATYFQQENMQDVLAEFDLIVKNTLRFD